MGIAIDRRMPSARPFDRLEVAEHVGDDEAGEEHAGDSHDVLLAQRRVPQCPQPVRAEIDTRHVTAYETPPMPGSTPSRHRGRFYSRDAAGRSIHAVASDHLYTRSHRTTY